MKVLGISASPRRNGNSEILLDKVIEGASYKGAKTEKIILNELSIKPCQGCESCHTSGICYIDDDMRYLYRKLKSADAVVIASPVYFGSITAQLKTMIDRCQSVWAGNFILNRKRKKSSRKRRGIFISVSGHNRRSFFRNSKEIVNILFVILGIKLFKELYISNLEYKGDVLKRRAVLKKAFRLGMELASA